MALSYDLGSLLQAGEGVLFLLIAGITAAHARRQLKDAHETRIAQLKPNVAIAYERDSVNPLYYNLVIKNFGPGVACNIRMTVDGSITLQNGKPLANTSLFSNNIPFLGPAERLQTAFDTSGSRRNKTNPDKFEVAITCLDVENRPYRSRVEVNTKLYDDVVYVTDSGASRPEETQAYLGDNMACMVNIIKNPAAAPKLPRQGPYLVNLRNAVLMWGLYSAAKIMSSINIVRKLYGLMYDEVSHPNT